jgi:hypothetical protein
VKLHQKRPELETSAGERVRFVHRLYASTWASIGFARKPDDGKGAKVFCDSAHGADVDAFFEPRVSKFDGMAHALAATVEAIERCAPATAVVLGGAIVLYRVWGHTSGLWYWAVAATISSLMPIWAAYLPHRLASRHPIVRAVGRMAQACTPIVTSFAYHHQHHHHPRVPTALLPTLERTQ